MTDEELREFCISLGIAEPGDAAPDMWAKAKTNQERAVVEAYVSASCLWNALREAMEGKLLPARSAHLRATVKHLDLALNGLAGWLESRDISDEPT